MIVGVSCVFWRSHKTKDLICGMDVDDRRAIRREVEGKTYYFCSEACATIAAQNPRRLSDAQERTKVKVHDMGSVHGCCT